MERKRVAAVSRADKEGLPFYQPEFEVCAWCGFNGLDAKPAVFYVDDIRLE